MGQPLGMCDGTVMDSFRRHVAEAIHNGRNRTHDTAPSIEGSSDVAMPNAIAL